MDFVVQIIILALIAAFLGYKLYSVLGRRAEHEEETLGRLPPPSQSRDASALPARDRAQPTGEQTAPSAMERAMSAVAPGARRAVQEIAAADRTFEPARFIEGARSAYGMILEAFWQGDKETLQELCDDGVYESFAAAIDARVEAGEVVSNRLIRIEQAEITAADFSAPMAHLTVRFLADIAAMTHDRDGAMIAGSLDDAVESDDVWTFSRRVDAAAPNWLLESTDAA
ncbi:Tim44/TimA family putative adaptor protein [Croceicoccus sp. F390]|uniref:Tim44/TimA family putative adaptor protein n=1 Tax=Croceicoccus esteveae TaxID=3075597 RepID=A0ABU2ZGN7_9SPHN|nr:Tim44/TimA family putative adaptor protein [Croceicoccus sp. F390]MDT0575755.1 Tim44/TimA family putative adaptor protein [Croceicoccus sp. F390]